MNIKKLVSIGLIGAISCGMLTGCGGPSASKIKNIQSMTMSEVAGSRLLAATNNLSDASIYDYVSDRIVVDSTKLTKPNPSDERNINVLMENINKQLLGRGEAILSDKYANYLLLEFARTPFEWAQSNIDIVGFDPAARLYFVDVTYNTTGAYKTVVPDSKIPLGHSDEDALRQKRYNDYMTWMTEALKQSDKAATLESSFVNAWGNVQDIFKEQQGVSLYERTILDSANSNGGIGRLTYSGLVRDNKFKYRGAKMTVRYVLKYALNLGEETDLGVEALYLKNYEIDNPQELLDSYTLKDEAALEVLKPFIDQLILSYNKCVEESNHIGLYSLFTDYSTLDKYYDEINDYTYTSVGGYNYKILERMNNGKDIAVKVSRVNQVRARGAEMSLPTYDETWLFNMRLGTDDKITIIDSYLVKSELIGEPLSVIRNVSGISDQIQYNTAAFSKKNETAVKELLTKFSALVTNSDYQSQDFLDCIDLGISQGTLNKMADTISAIKPQEKYSYIVNWNTKTNVYCSVTLREIFICENGNFDTEAVVDIGNRNGEWKIVNYTRTMNVKTDKPIMDKATADFAHKRTKDGEVTVIDEIKENVVEKTEDKAVEVDVEDPLAGLDKIQQQNESNGSSGSFVGETSSSYSDDTSNTSSSTTSSSSSSSSVSSEVQQSTVSNEPTTSNNNSGESVGDFD